MKRSTIIILLTIPLAAFFLERAGLLSPARAAVAQIITPVSAVLTRATLGMGEQIRAIRSIQSLIRENNELRAKNIRLEGQLASQFDVLHENDILRAELGLAKRETGKKGIPAFIVGRSRTGPYGTFLLDRGEKDGIAIGQVATSEGVLVGRVIEVTRANSVLLPITNVNSAVPVTLVESRGMGLLRGGVKGLTVEQVARDVEIKAGEAVITSAMGGLVPAGLLVGKVESVISNPADVFQSVAVSSPLSFNWLELVMVWP